MQRRLHTDWQLQARMAFTMLLLAALYLVFAVILYQAGLGIGFMVVILGGLALAQYYYSDRLVLATTRARIVSDHDLPEVHSIVARLAAMANVPKPRVALIESPMLNAFATGRNPSHAVVAVTSGLVRALPPAELEAVLGHEMTHIRNRDMAVLAFASFFSTIAGYLTQVLFYGGMFGGFGYGGGRGRGRNSGASLGVVLLVSWVVQLVSFFLIMALSRYREYAADRGSALLTGQPGSLASALMRISGTMSRIPTRDLRQSQTANAFFIVPAAIGREGLLELLQTHPTLEHRLNQLRRIELELAGRRVG